MSPHTYIICMWRVTNDHTVMFATKPITSNKYYMDYCKYLQGRSQDLGGGGGARIYFFRFGNLHVAKPCALLRGFGGMLNLVRFDVYFDPILSLKFFEKYHFYIKNKYFRYTLAIGYYS